MQKSAAEEAGSQGTGFAPLPAGVGEFFFPSPEQNFYVYVAGKDLRAEQFFAPLAEAGRGPGVFDMLQGNVVVSSDASLTENGIDQGRATANPRRTPGTR